jgi:hypothetical protein
VLLRSTISSALFVLLCGTASADARAQSADAQYLSATLEETSKKNAAYFRVPNGVRDGHFVGTIFSMDGRLKAEGTYIDSLFTVPHGSFVFYHANGTVESKGEYRNGKKTGPWERFDAAGKALAVKIYDHEPLENIIYTRAHIMPRYPQGDDRVLVRHIKDQVNAAGETKVKGNMTASFVVEKSGALSGVKVSGGESPVVEQRVADAIRSTAPWVPGSEKGQPVRVQIRLPVNF